MVTNPTIPPTIVGETVSVLEKLSISAKNEVVAVDGPASNAAAAKPAPKKAMAKKAPAKKAAPKSKAVVKKSVCLYESSDESDDFTGDDSESEAERNVALAPSAPSRARSGRAAAQKVTYVIDSSDEEMSDEESDF